MAEDLAINKLNLRSFLWQEDFFPNFPKRPRVENFIFFIEKAQIYFALLISLLPRKLTQIICTLENQVPIYCHNLLALFATFTARW